MAKVAAKQTDKGSMQSGQTANKSQTKGTKVKR
jgi:hypothetical protein